MKDCFPISWRRSRLGDILPLSYGKGLPKRDRIEGTYPVLGSNGVVGSHAAALTNGPALVVGRKGAAGAVYFARTPAWVIDTAYFTCGRDGVDLRFAYHLLSWLQLGSWDRSTAIPSLSRDDYSSIGVAVPDQQEQRRIAAKIDELYSDLDAGVTALERAKANLVRYRAAVLKAAVEGKLTEEWRWEHPDVEPASELLKRILVDRRRRWEEDQLAEYEVKEKRPPTGWKDKYIEPLPPPDESALERLPNAWCWATLSQIGFLDRGKSRHRPRNDPSLYGGKYPFVQTGDVRHAETVISTVSQTYNEKGLAQSRLWPAGTLCITIAANIAETAILGFDACFPDSVVGFLPGSASLSVRYIELFIRTMQARLESLAPATAQKNINLQVLRDVAIALPPELEQDEIVNNMDASLSIAANVALSIENGAMKSRWLRRSILRQAFTGELS